MGCRLGFTAAFGLRATGAVGLAITLATIRAAWAIAGAIWTHGIFLIFWV